MSQKVFGKKEYIIATAFLAFDLAVLIVGASFLTSNIDKVSHGISQREADLAGFFEEQRAASKEKENLEQIKSQLTILDQAFLPIGDQSAQINFLKLLENMAQRTNNLYKATQTDSLSADKAKKSEDITFQINLTGSFPDFMHFLKYIENMNYFTQVESLRLSQSGSGSSYAGVAGAAQGNLAGLIDLKVFVKK